MLSVRLSEKNERCLSILAAKMSMPKSKFINEALEEYLDDKLDYLAACEILDNSKPEDRIPWESVKEQYGI